MLYPQDQPVINSKANHTSVFDTISTSSIKNKKHSPPYVSIDTIFSRSVKNKQKGQFYRQ